MHNQTNRIHNRVDERPGVTELSQSEMKQVYGGIVTIEYLVLGTYLGERSRTPNKIAAAGQGGGPHVKVFNAVGIPS